MYDKTGQKARVRLALPLRSPLAGVAQLVEQFTRKSIRVGVTLL
jgi:hypothetical protein